MTIHLDRQRRSIGLAVAILCSLIAAVAPAVAQVDTGAIVGTITDQTGAVIPRVKVSLLNQGTGLTVSAVTDANGSYTFSPVRLRTYTVTAEYQGFDTAAH